VDRRALRPPSIDEAGYIYISHFLRGPISIDDHGTGGRDGRVGLAAVTNALVDE